ncbi:DUF7507 domain-containing protein [Leptolyngbya sp. AN02str]|uniref:DUF7507 domain-containing protein n=1 Tax=Leptolyngbya sp. AN02str TaxID=3423363 RepID=UPI003D3106A8
MYRFSRWLRYSGLFLASLLLALGLSYGITPQQPLVAQTVLTITNQGSASFENPSGEVTNVPSDETSFTVLVQPSSLELIKTADRAAAEPGDTVVYRLLVRNTGAIAINNLQIDDQLPLGLEYVAGSAQASLSAGSVVTPVTLPPPVVNGRSLTFTFPRLEPAQTLNLAYAVLLTPDSIRGNGRNQAIACAEGVECSESSYQLVIRPGILSDCGTIVGRVFVDRNFDGEQQSGEPGVPNAVIFMDDGNRVVTDADGLFSLANVVAGNRVGALDLTSLPGYTLAPNLYRIEGNSPSRLVRLAPGGLARMNFAVTPTFGEGQS